MYASFFGLERMPFNGLSSSDELFLHASFRHAGEQLRDGIKRGTRLLLLTAERGTGKTVLLKMLDERLERDGFKVCSLAASVGMGELHNARDSAQALEGAPQASAGSPHPSIGTILASATSEAPVVVLVDDADLLNNEVLQSLVDLAGSDSTLQGSLRIVLAGTPNLSSRLHAAGASALLEKGQAQAFLAPLSEHEVGEYVAHKLQAAGSKLQTLFDQAVIREVCRCGGGLPRRINTVCGMALLIAYENGKRRVEPAMVAEAVNDLEGDAGELRSRIRIESGNDREPADRPAVQPGAQPETSAAQPRPFPAQRLLNAWSPAWRATVDAVLRLGAIAAQMVKRGWSYLSPSRPRGQGEGWRNAAIIGPGGSLRTTGARRERDWLGLKVALVGLFAIAIIVSLVTVVRLDTTPAPSPAAMTDQAPSVLHEELRNLRNALDASNAARIESERTVTEQQARIDDYRQQSAAMTTELEELAAELEVKRNRSHLQLTLPRNVALTVTRPDGQQLRVDPEVMEDQQIKEVILSGDVDLRGIAHLLALAEHEQGQPLEGRHDGFRPAPSEALAAAFSAGSDSGSGALEATRQPAASAVPTQQPPELPPRPDQAQRRSGATTVDEPERDDAATSAEQLAALLEREPPAAGLPPDAAEQSARIEASSLPDEPALAEKQPGSISNDAAQLTAKVEPAPRADEVAADYGDAARRAAGVERAPLVDSASLAEPQLAPTMDSRALGSALVSAPVQPDLAPLEDKATYRTGATPRAQSGRAQASRPQRRVQGADVTPAAGVPGAIRQASVKASAGMASTDTPSSPPKDVTRRAGTPAPAGSGFQEYRVVAGDTLSAIAKRSGATVAELREWNGLSNSYLRPGQVLRIVDAGKPDPVADSKLLAAAHAGNRQAVTQMLDGGASMDARDEENRTALMLAASRGHLDVVQLLLDRGSPADTGNGLVGSALAYAAWNGHARVVAELLRRGSRLDVTNKGGWTPLIFAAINGHVGCVQQLLKNGADANARNLEGRTALSAAVWNRHTDVARVLLDAGADVNTKTGDGWTPLLDAAVNDDAAMVSLLLEFGADPSTKNEAGMTPLAIAEEHGNEDVIKAISQVRPSSS